MNIINKYFCDSLILLVVTILSAGCNTSATLNNAKKNTVQLNLTDCNINQGVNVNSPDNSIRLLVDNSNGSDGKKQLTYSLSYKNDIVINKSQLGITRDDADFHSQLNLESCSTTRLVTSQYKMLHGAFSDIRNVFNEKTLTFSNTQGKKMELLVRSYNNGVAFKYRFTGQGNDKRTILNEWTNFSIPVPADGGVQIAQDYVDNPQTMAPKAQSFYVPRGNNRAFPAIGSVSSNTYGFGLPLLLKTSVNQHPYWIFIHEAGINGDYPAAHIANPVNGVFQIAFPDTKEALGQFGDGKPRKSGFPWETPWRYIVISPSLNTVVEQTLTTDLAAPPVITDTSWILPGKASWNWASDHNSSLSFEEVKSFIDLASEMRWPYSLVDANWDKMKDAAGNPINIKTVADYAKTKNVSLFLWVNSGALENSHNTNASTPKGVLNDPDRRRAWMKSLSDLGIKGLKVDMIQTNKQGMMYYLQAILKDAADAHLMVLFHNTTPPRGWERTWPNLIGTEAAVTGGDYYGGNFAQNDQLPEMNAILPFTRASVGSIDYSPTMIAKNFNTKNPNPRRTTLAHELALPVIMESGLVIFSDNKQNYQSLAKPLQEYLREIPATWDETKLVEGYPAKYAVIARRKGNDWYIAGINGEVTAMSVQNDTTKPDYTPPTSNKRMLKMDFTALKCRKPASTLLIRDSASQQLALISHPTLAAAQKQTLKPFGGFVLILKGCAN